MDPRLRKRILMFYFAGVINAVLGFYILIKGPGFLEPSKVTGMSLFFFAFAAVDFYFPRALKKKWQAEQERLAAMRDGQGGAG